MSIHRMVRCDSDDCPAEAPLVRDTDVISIPPSYSVPGGWLFFDDRHFCSYQCVSDYADEKAQG